ncbi:MAG: hypothetical protein ACTSVY_08855, partial [Candidatus Helarchaeota archaeon]
MTVGKKKKKLDKKSIEDHKKRMKDLDIEKKKVVKEAIDAENLGNYLDAARYYKIASQLSSKIGEIEKSREYDNKSRENARRQDYLRKKMKTEQVRLQSVKKIFIHEKNMREAIEIGEVAAGEERWDDAAKYYRIAAKYA